METSMMIPDVQTGSWPTQEITDPYVKSMFLNAGQLQ